MKRTFKRTIALALACLLLAACLATGALAGRDGVIPEAQSLEVYLTLNGSTTLLHTYSITELESLAASGTAEYCSIDAMPARVKTIASGVYLDDLFSNLQDDYMGETWLDEAYRIRFTATDGAARAYTYDELDAQRWYYPALFQAASWDSITGTVNASEAQAGKTPVRPMLALTSSQFRVDHGSQPAMSAEARLRFCIGITDADLSSGRSTTSSLLRGVCRIDVVMDSDPSFDNVSVTGLDMDMSAATLNVGKTVTLTARAIPEDATNKDVTWQSSNPAAATVSDGVVTGVAPGSAVITARSAENSAITAVCTVNVEAASVPVTGVLLDKAAAILKPGEQTVLIASALPAEATNKNIVWQSGNEAIAAVANGVVTGIAPGVVNIYAFSAENAACSAICQVSVIADTVPAAGVSLNTPTLSLNTGDVSQLAATVLPENATNKNVYWASDAPNIVSVDTLGGLTARAAGTTTITVITEDGNFMAQCAVTVTEKQIATEPAVETPPIETPPAETVPEQPTAAETPAEEKPVEAPPEPPEKTEPEENEPLEIFPEKLEFSDVPESAWYNDAVYYAANAGLFKGTGGGAFSPDAPMTRAMFVTVLSRVKYGSDAAVPQGAASFSDLTQGWYINAVAWGATNGIVKGTSGAEFSPDASVTREQMAVFLYRYAQYAGRTTAFDKTALSGFTDAASVSDYARDAMAWAVGSGLMNGTSATSLEPSANATRAQVAAIIMRFCG